MTHVEHNPSVMSPNHTPTDGTPAQQQLSLHTDLKNLVCVSMQCNCIYIKEGSQSTRIKSDITLKLKKNSRY